MCSHANDLPSAIMDDVDIDLPVPETKKTSLVSIFFEVPKGDEEKFITDVLNGADLLASIGVTPVDGSYVDAAHNIVTLDHVPV